MVGVARSLSWVASINMMVWRKEDGGRRNRIKEATWLRVEDGGEKNMVKEER